MVIYQLNGRGNTKPKRSWCSYLKLFRFCISFQVCLTHAVALIMRKLWLLPSTTQISFNRKRKIQQNSRLAMVCEHPQDARRSPSIFSHNPLIGCPCSLTASRQRVVNQLLNAGNTRNSLWISVLSFASQKQRGECPDCPLSAVPAWRLCLCQLQCCSWDIPRSCCPQAEPPFICSFPLSMSPLNLPRSICSLLPAIRLGECPWSQNEVTVISLCSPC